MKLKRITIFLLALMIGGATLPAQAFAVENERSIVFPVLGKAKFRNDYGEPRSGGRKHEGTDIMAEKMRSLVAAVDGEISFITEDEATWGWSLSILDIDGYEYNYLHLNNDTPGTDDGEGGYNNAFASGIKLGAKVKKGQVIGYLGDSGNAETTPPHLHFEIREAKTQKPINPYESLKVAKVLTDPASGGKKKSRNSKSKQQKEKAKPTKEIQPFGDLKAGANLASGNLDADADTELVAGTGFAGSAKPEIAIMNTNGKKTKSFLAFDKTFTGGVDVSTADIDSDGTAEIIAGSGPGQEATVKIFKANGKLLKSFVAYSNFNGGVRVSSNDINGDGKIEIITGVASGGGPHVKIFSTEGEMLKEVMALSSNFAGGVDVASFAPSGSYAGGFVVASGPGGGPHVKVFDYDLNVVGEFMAFPQSFSGGLRVESGNFIQNNGSFEVVVVPASNSSGSTKIFKTSGELIKSSNTNFEDTWTGGFDVAVAGPDTYISSIGGRKTTVKKVSF